MALTDKKILESERNAVYVKSNVGDRLTGTVTENKDAFDKFPNLVMTKFNELIDLLILLNLDSIATDITNRYTKTETDELIENATDTLVSNVSIDTDTGIITVTKKDGTFTTVDTAIEKIPATFEFVSSGGKYYIKVTNVDGTTSQTDVTNLMNQYTFTDTSTIEFITSTSGTTTNVTASVKSGAITFTELDTEVKGYFDGLKSDVTADKASVSSMRTEVLNASATVTANAAAVETAKTDAETYYKYSRSYAKGDSGTRSGEATDNAQYYSQQAQLAKVAAEKARDEAQTAAGGDFSKKANEYVGSLTVAGWTASGDEFTQTLSVTGLATSGYAYLVSPTPENLKHYAECGVYSQDVTVANKITFKATSQPTSNISVNILKVQVA